MFKRLRGLKSIMEHVPLPFFKGAGGGRKAGGWGLSVVQDAGLRGAAQLAERAMGVRGAEDVWSPEAWQVEVLRAVQGAMCAYEDEAGEPALPAADEVGALEVSLRFLGQMPEATQRKLWDVLTLLEVAPSVLGPEREVGRFSGLSAAGRQAHLAMWCDSPLAPQRAAFEGVKAVCMMGYWTRDAVWPAIGYGLPG